MEIDTVGLPVALPTIKRGLKGHFHNHQYELRASQSR